MTTLAETRRDDDRERIEALEGAMLEHAREHGTVECPLDHFFADGVYVRQMTAPGDTLIVGHEHRFNHVCVLLKGRITLATPDGVTVLAAPLTWVAKPGRKVFYTHEETVLQNIFANAGDERDIEKLEDVLVVKSETWHAHQENAALVERVRHHHLSGRSEP